MKEVINEKGEVDKEKLNEIGVVLHEDAYESEGSDHTEMNVKD